MDGDRQFWTYPPHELDLKDYPRAAQIEKELAARDNSKEPANFDEYYRQKIGPTLYDMFTDHYSKKMWMIDDNKVFDIFKWSAKDNPIEKGTREAYKGAYLGYPISKDGYNAYFAKMTEGVEVILNAEAKWRGLPLVEWPGGLAAANQIISTIPVDELCGYRHGKLPYIGRDFFLLVLPCKEVFPGDVRFCHYAGQNDTWTRVTEFKKITFHESEDTLLVLEKPSKANKLYPYLTKKNVALAERYLKMLPEHVYSIGRLGTYKYSTIEQTIAQAFECVSKITGKKNEMEGQFFGIGDTSMMKDRKEECRVC